MFERQKNRMGKFTRDHKEEYKQFKGHATKNDSGNSQVWIKVMGKAQTC